MNTYTLLGAIVGSIIGIGASSLFFPWCMERYGERGVVRSIIIAIIAAIVILIWISRPVQAGPFVQLRAASLLDEDYSISYTHNGNRIDIRDDVFGRLTLGYRVRWNETVKGVAEWTHRSSLETPEDDGQNWIEFGVDFEWN